MRWVTYNPRKTMIVINKKTKADDGFARYEAAKARKEFTPAPPKHPLVELGEGLRPFDYAKTLLEHTGELKTHHGQPWLNDPYATPKAIMLAANRVLKANGLPQIGGQSEWRV
jgi:hypothetical protein